MSVTNTGTITFHGQSMTLVGLKLKVGDRARDVRVTGIDLSPVLPLAASEGKARLFMTLPSIDTSVCSMETKKFSDAIQEFGQAIAAFVVSADLPFAQQRWCLAEGINNLTMLSDYRAMDFARSWGLLISELGLLARAVYVVNPDSIVTYCEIVPEITAEPNYEAAIAALRAVV
ncbi:MAG: thiol peroxidase [Synechococcales cyanobacterium C42_A2020_086]|jgi:thiol peroxidase|nr:thiol peroxidase [Synechococcales cyanobacterium C42_A2020_086]